jgi:peptidyl-tRNA hydrolase, PTH1 family
MGESEQHRVIVGLGNPGQQYRMTRHNIGYLVAEQFAVNNGWVLQNDRRFSSFIAKGMIGDKTVHILMPTTYMNESGRAVRAYLNYYKLGPQNMVAITDDTALPFGIVRVRAAGSSGGHNGLKSLEAHLGTTQYARIRMGIGKNPFFVPLADYVLGLFNAAEQTGLQAFIDSGMTVVKRLLTEDIASVMNAVNTRLESKPVDLEKDQEK